MCSSAQLLEAEMVSINHSLLSHGIENRHQHVRLGRIAIMRPRDDSR